MNIRIYQSASDLKGFSIKNSPSMPLPTGALMCEPRYYNITEAHNPFMRGSIGTVDTSKAMAQWQDVKKTIEGLGCPVKTIEPVEGLEDMVFAANQTFTGLTRKMEKVCLLGQMRHPSRRLEVPHFEKWFEKEGYRIARLKDSSLTFEGMGDCLWHPGKRLLWGGFGFRTDPEVYEEVAQIFEVPVVALKLVNERFYHLDTCFSPLNQEAVLIYPAAFAPESLELILKLFPIVLAADEQEAMKKLVCNTTIIDATSILQAGASTAAHQIQAIGLDVHEVDTSEFIKSGASSFCLKMNLY